MRSLTAIAALVCGVITIGAAERLQPNRALLKNPDDPAWNQRAPDVCRILLDTSKGSIVIEMTRAWSPHGVDRFYNLVRHGYYDEARVLSHPRRASGRSSASLPIRRSRPPGARGRSPTIHVMVSNARGTLAYAFKDPNGRTTQVFINLRDNAATHDEEPFVPFARIDRGPRGRRTPATPNTARAPAAASGRASRIRSLPRATVF